jgi:hypothetical protein
MYICRYYFLRVNTYAQIHEEDNHERFDIYTELAKSKSNASKSGIMKQCQRLLMLP